MTIIELVVNSGNARSTAMEAIAMAKEGNIEQARETIEAAREEIAKAHHTQTDLIQGEAAGKKTDVGLLMVHAQDHLMNALTVIDLATEMVEMYDKFSNKITS